MSAYENANFTGVLEPPSEIGLDNAATFDVPAMVLARRGQIHRETFGNNDALPATDALTGEAFKALTAKTETVDGTANVKGLGQCCMFLLLYDPDESTAGDRLKAAQSEIVDMETDKRCVNGYAPEEPAVPSGMIPFGAIIVGAAPPDANGTTTFTPGTTAWNEGKITARGMPIASMSGRRLFDGNDITARGAGPN